MYAPPDSGYAMNAKLTMITGIEAEKVLEKKIADSVIAMGKTRRKVDELRGRAGEQESREEPKEKRRRAGRAESRRAERILPGG